jgi:hypothetical protein
MKNAYTFQERIIPAGAALRPHDVLATRITGLPIGGADSPGSSLINRPATVAKSALCRPRELLALFEIAITFEIRARLSHGKEAIA